jgi:23S rRNA (guanosine2251-2'-O)-methyltransferase
VEDEIWIWGRHPVLEALRAGTVREILIATGLAPSHVVRDIRVLAGRKDVPVRDVAQAELQRRFKGQATQGVAASARPPSEIELDTLLQSVRSGSITFVLALDQIQDPHNLGALLRTAAAAAVEAVVLPERRSAPLSGTAAKASAGMMSRVDILRAPNLARALTLLREAGLWIVGLDADGDHSLFAMDLTIPVALVVGGEQRGLRRLTREHCDMLASLPLVGAVESLNASVAGSIAMYEVVRQRNPGD